jgi:hypothetical protein
MDELMVSRRSIAEIKKDIAEIDIQCEKEFAAFGSIDGITIGDALRLQTELTMVESSN